MKAFKHEKRGGAFGHGSPMRSGGQMVGQKKITRTSAGLRDALFDAIEKLREGELDGSQAHAMATLAKQICQTVQLEIEVAKLRTEYPADSPIVVPKPLQLGEEKVDPAADEQLKVRKVQSSV